MSRKDTRTIWPEQSKGPIQIVRPRTFHPGYTIISDPTVRYYMRDKIQYDFIQRYVTGFSNKSQYQYIHIRLHSPNDHFLR